MNSEIAICKWLSPTPATAHQKKKRVDVLKPVEQLIKGPYQLEKPKIWKKQADLFQMKSLLFYRLPSRSPCVGIFWRSY